MDNIRSFSGLEAYEERTAVIEASGRHVSYGALLSKADALAGLVKGRSLAFIGCASRLPSICAYIGFLRAGVVPVLVNSGIEGFLLDGLIESYRPAYIFFPADCLPENIKGDVLWREDSYVLLSTDFGVDYGLNEDLALLLTTSGSTGSPKLVRQSYGNINSNTSSIIEYLGIDSSDRAISTLPMHYTYGLSIINTHLAAGASLVLTEATMMEKEFWSLIKEHGVSTFGGVPYVYEILKKFRFARMDLPSLRYLTQAGGRLSPELSLEFSTVCRDKNMEFIVMYGQTEATARMSWLPWEYAFSKAGSIGVAIPGGRLWLADAEGRRIETPGTVGELIYEGPNVTLGYAANRHELSLGDERGGQLHTGDMAEFDGDGFFYIRGRKKRFLKLFGSRINLDELENMLGRLGHECVCAGQDDKLAVYLTQDAAEVEVEAFLAGQLLLNRAGFKVHIIERIPRNESGKVLYSALPRL